ncbi:pilus assembly protein TadG-related protein [Sphingosinicella microcystinivorans]|uniref:Flp pilus assembly protein TadG n=2 Tax=Sphingosinicella microcystinivorans TaxID=335406 RepID=A0ABX9SVZ1_SPHMI|nr:pilus assembly protein TadG-related protein [Sphingosinicella microcystinivorans]RKS86435.1 Flp pilus assembly protein TadG [Sphingosinicella microcystinivorans]
MSLGSNTPGHRMKAMQSSTFLSRLRRDQKGNALAIVAASVIPLVGAIGGGVDLTRAYMAEARLAQACDAAALAGRKVMTKDDVDSGGTVLSNTTADQEIQKFLDYNFPEGKFDTGEITRTAQVDEQGELTVTLATTISTQLLRIAGIQSMDINAECSARRAGVNVDVVLVVDVTGSMRWDVNSNSGSDNERMIALQSASKKFLDILKDLQDQLSSSGLRVRVGIVPYSQGVNVGKLLHNENADYIDYTGEPYSTNIGEPYMATVSGKYAWKNYSVTGTYDDENLDLDQFVSLGLAETTPSNPYAWKGCVEARSTVTTIDASSSPYTTIPVGAWDVIDAAPGTEVEGQIAPKWRPYFAPPWASSSVGGVSVTGNKYRPNSTYMDITKEPWASLNWRMQNDSNTYSSKAVRYDTSYASLTTGSHYADGVASTGPNKSCPNEAKLLTQIDADGVTTLGSYIDALQPAGGTYHELGMYWGLALISPGAPFPNESTYLAPGHTGEERGINRYIVFMSDGEIDPGISYSAYGQYLWDHRTRSNTTEPKPEHRARFRMICEAAKKQGIKVSTVAFSTSIGSTDKTAIEQCASSEDDYYVAETADDLNKAFEKIAQNIGYLRVSK